MEEHAYLRILTFFLKQYNSFKQCHRKPRKSRAKKAENKVSLAKGIMDTQFTLFGR